MLGVKVLLFIRFIHKEMTENSQPIFESPSPEIRIWISVCSPHMCERNKTIRIWCVVLSIRVLDITFFQLRFSHAYASYVVNVCLARTFSILYLHKQGPGMAGSSWTAIRITVCLHVYHAAAWNGSQRAGEQTCTWRVVHICTYVCVVIVSAMAE